MPKSKKFDKTVVQKRHKEIQKAVISYNKLTDLPVVVQKQLAHLSRNTHNIAVLYYGGTIGMELNKKKKWVPTNNADSLLKPLKVKGLDKKLNAIWFQVYPKAIDSTNARWPHWVSIANAIRILYDIVDGFVILGGTDTMAHMAAAINFVMPNLGKPVISTGSQKPMSELGDDAQENLSFALLAACSNLSGCHLAFRAKLMHGLHVFKVKDQLYDAFKCESRYELGEFKGGATVDIYEGRASRRNPLVKEDQLEFYPYFMEGVKVIHISPASAPESLLHDGADPLSAVMLLITYGAGNVINKYIYKGELTHADAIEHLRKNNVPTVLGTSMQDGRVDSSYAPGVEGIERGGISGNDTRGPTLEVKIMRALYDAWNFKKKKVRLKTFKKKMNTNYVGELTPIKK